MSDATVRGRFVWHELLTTDTKAAAGFFTKLIGWKTRPWPQDPSYAMFFVGKQSVAGLMTLPDDAKAMGAPPNWLTYIGTPDVAATVRQVLSLGGRVLKETQQLPSVGSFAVLQDPQGAAFGVYTPEQSAPDAPAAEGDFSWHELATTDWQAALAFYQRVFGWEAGTPMDMGPGLGMYQIVSRNGRMVGGLFNKPAEMQGPAFWLPYIRVKDSRQTAAAAQKLKGKIINGPMEVPGGDWIAQGMDLQGAVFAVHSVTPAVAAPAPAANANKAKTVTKTARPANKAAARQAAKKPAAKKPAAKRAPKKKPTRGKPARSGKKTPAKGRASASRRKAGTKKKSRR